ncbi:hypothetical protein ACS0TY_010194 [Phlomoides rotata]
MVFPMDNLQDEFFYDLMWCESITESLITFLLAQKQMGNWVWNSNNASALLEACEYLNSTFHTNYTSIEVLGRVKKLCSRYGLFSHMISQSGMVWNREQNYVYASPAQWALWREVVYFILLLNILNWYFLQACPLIILSLHCLLFCINNLQLYPMAQAYMTQGDPLYTDLKSLFATGRCSTRRAL